MAVRERGRLHAGTLRVLRCLFVEVEHRSFDAVKRKRKKKCLFKLKTFENTMSTYIS